MSKPGVYIIIVNYQKWTDTLECIHSLLASTYTDFSIIVVDNNSGNHSLQQLKESVKERVDSTIVSNEALEELYRSGPLPGLVLVQNSCNTGYAAANNIVLRQILQEEAYVWLLNPDMTVEKDTLQQLVSFTRQQTVDSVIGSVIKSYYKKNEVIFYGGAAINFGTGTVRAITKLANLPQLGFISGTSFFTPVSCFRKMGLLEEKYFLYWEETDWCFNAQQHGIKMALCKEAICYDKISTVIGKGFAAHYYYTRNGLFFLAKYANGKIGRALFAAGLRFLKRIGTGQWSQAKGVCRGVIDYLKNKHHAIE
jgi:GT2 family glycosyltransferase